MPGPVTLSSLGRRIDSEGKALLVARAIIEKQAEGVVVMNVRALSSVTDFFVLGTAGSPPHLRALREQVEATLAAVGESVWHIEDAAAPAPGQTPALQWVLVDCGDVVVHLLYQQAMSFYRLEDLWADAPRVPVPPEAA